MSIAPTPPATTPVQRFGLIIRGLLRSVGARARQNLLTGGYPAVGMARLPTPIAEAISARFSRASRLFAALADRVRLGTARVFPNRASPRAARPSMPPPGGKPGSADPAAVRLPRGFGGVLALLHWEAARCARELRELLSDPEMVALLQSVPGFARILRPLCRTLAIVPPPDLFAPLPRRPRRPRPRADIPPMSPTPAAAPPTTRPSGAAHHRTGLWARPKPMAWETRLEAQLARAPRKTC